MRREPTSAYVAPSFLIGRAALGSNRLIDVDVASTQWTTLRQETLNPVAGKATKGDLHESFYVERFDSDGKASQPLPPTLAAREKALGVFFQVR